MVRNDTSLNAEELDQLAIEEESPVGPNMGAGRRQRFWARGRAAQVQPRQQTEAARPGAGQQKPKQTAVFVCYY